METWKVYVIAGLTAANLAFAVVTAYMFRKANKWPLNKHKQQVISKYPAAIEGLKKKVDDLDLVIIESD